MKIADVIAVIEQSAPLHMQESFDNSGLIVGDAQAEVNSALICVDVTQEVLDEAIACGVGLVISHHPVIFNSIRRLTESTYVERLVSRALRAGVALYAAHTNLDAVHNGMSWRLASILGVGELQLLSPTREGDQQIGFGVVGELQSSMPCEEFLQLVMSSLELKVVRHSDLTLNTVRRVALCTGSGASLIGAAKRAQADIYLAADFKYNDFMEGDSHFIVADIGHFESEYCAIDLLYDIITKKIPTFALRKSVNSRNPVNYLV